MTGGTQDSGDGRFLSRHRHGVVLQGGGGTRGATSDGAGGGLRNGGMNMRRSRLGRWFLVGLVSCAPGCGRGRAPREQPVPAPSPRPSPAPAGSAEPDLAARDGSVVLSWLARGSGTYALQYAVLEDDGWSAHRTIASGESLFANWADFPSVVPLAGGAMAAHWLRKHGPGKFAYDVLVARSPDGASWPSGSMPHRDGVAAEHGFVSLVPDASGGLTAVWLDGRMFAGKEESDPSVQTQLRAADLRSGGFGDEMLLDDRVCDCCQTAAVRTRRGMLVAYRDRSPDEIRDIWLVRRDGDRWLEPYRLAADGWLIQGCPVNGPALAGRGDSVVVAWFTEAGDTARVQVAFSGDGGASFSRSVRVDEGKPFGRVDIAFLPNGDAIVVWMETTGGGRAAVRGRRLRRDLGAGPAFSVATTTAARASGFPRVTLAGETVWFAWTSDTDPPQVQIASLPLPGPRR